MSSETTPDTNAQVALWVDTLSGPSRRARQDASHEIGLVAPSAPESLVPYVEQLVDALFRPEAQTRWEILNALTYVNIPREEDVLRAVEGAETSLFDEGSSTVRLAAFRLLSKLGASAPEHSDEAWPLLSEAIQCFHGDPEYRDMLLALSEFAAGSISDETRAALVKRISFDAENGHGYIKTWSRQVLDAAQA